MTANMSVTLITTAFVMLCPALTFSDVCNYLPQRRFLDCSSAKLESVPSLEHHFNDVLGISLSKNFISTIKNKTFSRNSNLQTLDLSHNLIVSMESNAFEGLEQLISLNLSANSFSISLKCLPAELFKPLENLQLIRIQIIESKLNWQGIDATFSELRNLTTLFFSFPRNFIFGDGFRKLTKLTTISTSGRRRDNLQCQIGTLWNDTFAIFRGIPVQKLRLINCNIVHIESGAFDPLTSLNTLDLTSNIDLGLNAALRSLQPFGGRLMEEIKLAHLNRGSFCDGRDRFVIDSVEMSILLSICAKSLDLSENFISYAHDSDMKTISKCIENFNMSFHSLRCIPKVFIGFLSESIVLKSVDISNGFGLPKLQGDWVETSFSQNTNVKRWTIDVKVPKSLESIDMSSIASWRTLDAPVMFKDAVSMRSLKFAYNNLGNCTESMLKGIDNLTELDLSGLLCKWIHPSFFLHSRHLTTLSLNNCGYITNWDTAEFLKYLDLLENIDFSDNAIYSINPKLFLNNIHLRKINFSKNKLQRLPSAILHLRGLDWLDLSFNSFTYLNHEEMKALDAWMTGKDADKMFKLLLTGNHIACTCDTVLFIRWILQRKPYLDHRGNYTCFLANGSQASVYTFGEQLTNFEVKCVSQTYLLISVVGTLALVILLVIFAAIYRYRSNLRYWLYTKLKPPEGMFVDNQTYVYDAFVAYTEDDRSWVRDQLSQHLELGDEPFTLCLHDRDFTPGKFIHQNIVEKMTESRKIMLLISTDFLSSRYGPLEIEYAGMKSLDEGKDDIIICVLLEDIPERAMPRVLRNLWHKITFLKWSTDAREQDIFWRNLKFGLR